MVHGCLHLSLRETKFNIWGLFCAARTSGQLIGDHYRTLNNIYQKEGGNLISFCAFCAMNHANMLHKSCTARYRKQIEPAVVLERQFHAHVHVRNLTSAATFGFQLLSQEQKYVGVIAM